MNLVTCVHIVHKAAMKVGKKELQTTDFSFLCVCVCTKLLGYTKLLCLYFWGTDFEKTVFDSYLKDEHEFFFLWVEERVEER